VAAERGVIEACRPAQAAERGQAAPGEEDAADWDTAWVDEAGRAFEAPWFEEPEEGAGQARRPPAAPRAPAAPARA